MVTNRNEQYDVYGVPKWQKFIGLSTDTKPTSGVHNGDEFFEMDTGKTKYYNESASAWTT